MIARKFIIFLLLAALVVPLTGCDDSQPDASSPRAVSNGPQNYQKASEKPKVSDDRPIYEIFFDLSNLVEQQREEDARNVRLIAWSGAFLNAAPYGGSLVLAPVGAMIFASQYYPSWVTVTPARLQFDVAEVSGGGPFAVVGNALQNTTGTVLNGIANIIFSMAQAPVTWGTELIYMAFKTQWIAALASDIARSSLFIWGRIVGADAAHSRFINLVILVMSGFLLVYLCRLQILAILKTLFVSALVLVLAFAYFANVESVLKTTASLTDGLSGIVLSLVGGVSSGSGADVSTEGSAALDGVLQKFGDAMWQNLVANTWTALEFGTTRPEELALTEWEYRQIQRNTIFKENSYDPNTKTATDPLAAGWIVPGMRVDQLMLAYAYSSPCRQALTNIFAAHDKDADHGGHSLAPEKLSPLGKKDAIVSSFFFLVVSLVFFVFSLVVAGSMILAQITLVFIVLSLPFVFMIAMVPESGWAVAYKVGRMALAALMTKLVYGVFLSVTVLIVSLVFAI